jgi:hypothetical protein
VVAPSPDPVASAAPPSPPLATEPTAAFATPGVETSPPAQLEPEPEADTASAAPAPGSSPAPPIQPPTAEVSAAPLASVPLPGAPPQIDEALRLSVTAPPAPKRGPTKVRLLPVPESLYRTIEHGARESGMTVAAYLSALIEIARAAVGEDANEAPGTGGSTAAPGESGPSIRELFAQVQEAQAVEVGKSSAADGDSEQNEPSD